MITLNLFAGHEWLLGIILLLFLINFVCILYLVRKERKNDEAEIGEIITSLSNAKPRETVEQRGEELEKEEVEMVEEVNKPRLEIDKVLEKMEQDLLSTPEDAVASFEQEQEEKSIISYQELINSFKKSDSVVSEAKEMLKTDYKEEKETKIEEKSKEILSSDFKDTYEEIDFKEEQPQAFKTDFKEKMQEEMKVGDVSKIDVIDIDEEENASKIDVSKSRTIKEENPREKKKFQNTDFISPIYGKLDEKEMDYPTVPHFSRTEAIEELLEDADNKRSITKEGFGETLDVSPLHSEIQESDEFLKTLKDFRESL